jgi:hypothetical protein
VTVCVANIPRQLLQHSQTDVRWDEAPTRREFCTRVQTERSTTSGVHVEPRRKHTKGMYSSAKIKCPCLRLNRQNWEGRFSETADRLTNFHGMICEKLYDLKTQ